MPVELQIILACTGGRSTGAAHWTYKERSRPAGSVIPYWLGSFSTGLARPPTRPECLIRCGSRCHRRVYVFTPRRRGIALPQDATPWTSPRVHTELATAPSRPPRFKRGSSSLESPFSTARPWRASPPKQRRRFPARTGSARQERHGAHKDQALSPRIPRGPHRHRQVDDAGPCATGLRYAELATAAALQAIAMERALPDLAVLSAAVGDVHVRSQSVVSSWSGRLAGSPEPG